MKQKQKLGLMLSASKISDQVEAALLTEEAGFYSPGVGMKPERTLENLEAITECFKR